MLSNQEAGRGVKKREMVEADKGERIDEINRYLSEKLLYYKQKTDSMEEDRDKDWKPLNQRFLEILKLPR